MINFTGKGTASTCDGFNRRDFLTAGSLTAVGLSMADYAAAKERGTVKDNNKACVMIFNLGAPSHLDTWDPKPDAPAEIRGPFNAINTKSADLQISEIFPEHAKIADKFSVVRSCYHSGAAVHDAGWQMMQTGRLFSGGVETPHYGGVMSYLRGRKTDLPPFVVLPETMGRGGGNLPNGQGTRPLCLDGRSFQAQLQSA